MECDLANWSETLLEVSLVGVIASIMVFSVFGNESNIRYH